MTDQLSGGLTCDEIRDLAAPFVLDALDAAEMGAIREHLATCAEPHPEFAELGSVLPVLAASVPMVEPPAALKSRIMAAAAAELANRSRPDRPDRANAAPRGERRARGERHPSDRCCGHDLEQADRLRGRDAAPGWRPIDRDVDHAHRGGARDRPARRLEPPAPGPAREREGVRGQRRCRPAGRWRGGLVDSRPRTAGRAGPVRPRGCQRVGSRDARDARSARHQRRPGLRAWVIGSDGVPVALGGFQVDAAGIASFSADGVPAQDGIVLALTLEPGPGATAPSSAPVSLGTATAAG